MLGESLRRLANAQKSQGLYPRSIRKKLSIDIVPLAYGIYLRLGVLLTRAGPCIGPFSRFNNLGPSGEHLITFPWTRVSYAAEQNLWLELAKTQLWTRTTRATSLQRQDDIVFTS